MKSQKLLYCILILSLVVMPFFLSDNSCADPLDNWHWRNPLPQGNNVSGMAFGNGVFVAIGNVGTILTSPDGIIWTSRSSGTTDSLLGAVYGNGIFVAVGDAGVILTSSDGATWASQSSGTTERLSRIAYGNGVFVAVGEAGTILTSLDGVTWNTRASGSTSNLNDITYGNEIFVAVGGSYGCIVGPPCPGTPGIILTSTDGITWTPRFSGNPFPVVAYGNGVFVAMANTPPATGFNPSSSVMLVTSADGINWTQHSSPIPYVSELSYGDGIFLAAGESNVFTSPDGVLWTPQSSGTRSSLLGIAYGNGIFVAGGTLGVMLTSPDGVTWTIRSSGSIDNLSGVTYGGSNFVAVGDLGTILTSPDGTIWSTQSADTANRLFAVSYGNGIFVAVGYTSSCPIGECATILTSSDGVTWIIRFSDTANEIYGTSFRGVTYANDTFVAVGYAGGPSGNLTGAIFTSSDGMAWTPRYFGSDISFYNGVTYGNGVFVATGDHDIVTSQDGITWTTRYFDTSTWLDAITYGNGIFVAVGGGSNGTTILTSTDGISWAAGPSGPYDLSGVGYGNGTFVALEGAYIGVTKPVSSILTSTDGGNWSIRSVPTWLRLSGVAYGNGTFVVVGDNGTILQSDNMLSPWCSPTILANVSKGSITLNTSDALSLTAGLDPGNLSGNNADWWVAAYAPWGWYYYAYPDTWIYASTLDNILPAYQGPLFYLSPIEVLKITDLPAGTYTFYVGVDTNMNGHLDYDLLYFDYVSVSIIP